MADAETIAVVINMFRLPYLLTSAMVVCNGLKLFLNLTTAILLLLLKKI
jgi:hypothetical protein